MIIVFYNAKNIKEFFNKFCKIVLTKRKLYGIIMIPKEERWDTDAVTKCEIQY